jgi:Domain of unknown function (DUF4395)
MMDGMPRIAFSFPETVDEISARLVATGVVIMSATYLFTGWTPLLFVLVYGFAARVAYGPRFSPLARLVTQVIRPRLTSIATREVPGPPKRFAQGIGFAFSATALALTLSGATKAALLVIVALLGAASLEAFAGFCAGCWAYRQIMHAGLIPAEACEACNDLAKRPLKTPSPA